jgi:hypothetical protein
MWTSTNAPPVTGAIFGLGYAQGVGNGDGSRTVVITANAGGGAWTPDEGDNWFTLPGVTGYWAVAFASPKAGWLVGADGRVNFRSVSEPASDRQGERDLAIHLHVVHLNQ